MYFESKPEVKLLISLSTNSILLFFFKLFSRPVVFRPVANSILRRRDQTPAPVPVAPEEVEDEMEPTTRRTLRRASGRLIIIRPVTV